MEYDSMERLMVCRNFLQMPLVQAVNRYMQTNEETEVPYIVSQLVQYAENRLGHTAQGCKVR